MLFRDKPSNIWFSVSTSTSVMSPLILAKGRLFKMLLTSHNKVLNNSWLMVLHFIIDSREHLIDFMSDSLLPPINGLKGELKLYSISLTVIKF